MQPGDVMRYSFPRSDLRVTANGVDVKAPLALGSWVAFRSTGAGRAMMMGDLVLTEDEVGAVMPSLQQAGVEQTALHNHVLGEPTPLLHALLGERRRGEARPRAGRGARSDRLSACTLPAGESMSPRVGRRHQEALR